MTLPDYQSVTLPLLRLVATVPDLRLANALVTLSDHFQLTPGEREDVTSSGRTKMNSRVQWAATYLAQARLVSRPRRGYVAITPRGLDLLATNPVRIDYNLLRQYPEFVEKRGFRFRPQRAISLIDKLVRRERGHKRLVDPGCVRSG